MSRLVVFAIALLAFAVGLAGSKRKDEHEGPSHNDLIYQRFAPAHREQCDERVQRAATQIKEELDKATALETPTFSVTYMHIVPTTMCSPILRRNFVNDLVTTLCAPPYRYHVECDPYARTKTPVNGTTATGGTTTVEVDTYSIFVMIKNPTSKALALCNCTAPDY
jgi:hypothetical protein